MSAKKKSIFIIEREYCDCPHCDGDCGEFYVQEYFHIKPKSKKYTNYPGSSIGYTKKVLKERSVDKVIYYDKDEAEDARWEI